MKIPYWALSAAAAAISVKDASALTLTFVKVRQPLATKQRVPNRPNTRAVPQMNAALIPTAYRILAVGSVYRAATGVDPTSAVVLLCTATAATLDLAPAAAGQLTSAKRAATGLAPPAAGFDRARRWRNAVRVKILGQIAGLVVSAGVGGALVGAACVVGADCAFWAMDGGANRFECDGDGVRSAPIAAPLSRVLLGVNGVMLLSALVGCVFGQNRLVIRRGGAAVFCTGILSQVIGNEKTRRRKG